MSDPTSTQPTVASGPGGSIYDLGYQGYHGRRVSRRRGRWRCSPSRCGRATASGVAPGPRSCPFALAAWPSSRPSWPSASRPSSPRPARQARGWNSLSPIQYHTYASVIGVFVMLFCAAQAPELFGRDQRYRRAAAVFLAGAGAYGLCRRADRRAGRGAAADGARAAGAAVHGRLLTAPDPVTGWRLESPNCADAAPGPR